MASLQFNDTTDNKNGLIQTCESWVFGSDYGAISGNPKRLATFTRLLNNALDDISTDILTYDERWEFDDSNYTDYPIATKDLVDSQQDYLFDVTHIRILGVDVMDSSGNYQPLKEIDQTDIRKYGKGQSLTEYQETDGMPKEYDLIGNALFLYPAPASGSVTTATGLKVHFQRPLRAFVTSDTTKKPGIPQLFHELIAIKACARFTKQNSMTEKARELDAEEQKGVEKIKGHYANRNQYQPRRLQGSVTNTR